MSLSVGWKKHSRSQIALFDEPEFLGRIKSSAWTSSRWIGPRRLGMFTSITSLTASAWADTKARAENVQPGGPGNRRTTGRPRAACAKIMASFLLEPFGASASRPGSVSTRSRRDRHYGADNSGFHNSAGSSSLLSDHLNRARTPTGQTA